MIRDNLFVHNCTAQVQGSFDIATEAGWPKAMQTRQVDDGKAKEDWAAGYQARKDRARRVHSGGLTITFQGNLYVLDGGQRFFIWAPTGNGNRSSRASPV